MKMNYARPLTSFLDQETLSENWIVFTQSGSSTIQGAFSDCPAGLGRDIYSIAVSEPDTTLRLITTPQGNYNIDVYFVNENSNCMQFEGTSNNPGEAVNSGILNLQNGSYTLYILGIPEENFSITLQYSQHVDINLSGSTCFLVSGRQRPILNHAQHKMDLSRKICLRLNRSASVVDLRLKVIFPSCKEEGINIQTIT